MQRRSFIQLLAGGLLVPAELFRDRSQVAVGELWTPEPCTNPYCFEDDLQAGFDEILRSTGYTPNTLWIGQDTFRKLRDGLREVAESGDGFLGYDRTKLTA